MLLWVVTHLIVEETQVERVMVEPILPEILATLLINLSITMKVTSSISIIWATSKRHSLIDTHP